MRKRTRLAVAGIGLTLGIGGLAPSPARADCERTYDDCLYQAYRERNAWARQFRFVKCGVEYAACLWST